MKIRSGFVSNSSSSSFVVLGTRIPRKELDEMGWFDDGDYTDKVPKGISIYYDENKEGYIVGIPLCASEDWGLSSKEISDIDLKEMMHQASNKLNRPIKLMMGTRPT